MDAYGTNQFDRLQSQLQQLQSLMGQRSQPVAGAQQQAPQKLVCTVPVVDGLAGARQYLDTLGPNASCAVFDKEEAAFFLLSVDANSNPQPIKIGRFTLEDAPEPGSNTITRDDLDAFKAEIRGMLAGLMKKEVSEE